MKTDDLGDTLWVRKFGPTGSSERAFGICELSDTTYVLAGYSTGVDPSSDMYVVGITAAGDTSWSLDIGGSEAEEAAAVFLTHNNGCIVAGWTSSYGSGGQDVFLVKIGYPPEIAANPPAPQPTQFSLSAFPIPFNAITTLELHLPSSGRVNVSIYDLLGHHVVTRHDTFLAAGEHKFTFDASALPSGIYFARVQSGEFVKTQKLLLLK